MFSSWVPAQGVALTAHDLPSVEFYRSVGGVQESVFHFSFDTK